MTNANLLNELLKRRETLNAERRKLDEMIAFYQPEKAKAEPIIRVRERQRPVIKRNRKNGNTSLIYQLARDLANKQGYAPTDEIASLAKQNGIDEGHYSKGLAIQISGYMSRNKDFKSSEKGWVLR